MARPLIPLALALTLSACAQHASVGPDSLGPGYVTGGGDWTSGGGISVAVRATERNGATVICGAWTTDQQSALSIYLNDDVMEAGAISLGGHTAVRNLGFMQRHAWGTDLTGASANCIASRLAWNASFASAAPQVHLPRMTFVINQDNVDTVTFRPGPRPSLTP
jgi:hypothetical protein